MKTFTLYLAFFVLVCSTFNLYGQSEELFDNKIQVLPEKKLKVYLNDVFRTTPKECANFYVITKFEDHIYQFSDSVKCYYTSNDKLFIIGKYSNGQLHGKFKSYTEEGKLQMTYEYYYGVRNGLWQSYNNKGDIIKKVRYKNGIEFLIDFYDNQGNLVVNNGNGNYQEELTLSSTSNYTAKLYGKVKNGLPDGEWLITHNNIIIGKEYFKNKTFEKGLSISVLAGEVEYLDYFDATFTGVMPIEQLRIHNGYGCINYEGVGLGSPFFSKLNKRFYKLKLDKTIENGWFLIDISTGKNRKINDVQIVSNSDANTINLIKNMVLDLKNPYSDNRIKYIFDPNSNFNFFLLIIKDSKPYHKFNSRESELVSF